MSNKSGLDHTELMWLYDDIAAFEANVARYGAAYVLNIMSEYTRKELEKAIGYTPAGRGEDTVRKVS